MSRAMYKVSVIIPTYNVKDYIAECLESVLCQKMPNIEIICVDDASSDGTYDILKSYAKKYKNLRIFWQEKSGPGVARNKGIREATGEYVCMMDADDYYPNENVIGLLYYTAIKNDVLICGGNILDVYPDGRCEPTQGNFKREGFYDSKLEPRMYGQTRFLFNRNFIVSNNLSYLPYIRFEDPPFVFEAIMSAGKYYAINDYTYVRRAGYKGITTNHDISAGILYGILKCTNIAKKYGLKQFYCEQVAMVLPVCIKYLHPFLADDDKDIWEIMGKIVAEAGSWFPNRLTMFTSYKQYRAYLEDIKDELKKIRTSRKIVLYGAGKTAMDFLEMRYIDKSKIVGVGTTELTDQKSFSNFIIEPIDSILNNVAYDCIVIAASESNSINMKKKIATG